MNMISSKEAMLKAYDACKGLLGLRSVAPHDLNSTKKELLCCGGTGCHASNSPLLMENLRAAIKEHGLENDVKVVQTGCFGFCAQGPIVKVMPDNVFYVQVTPEDAREIVESHVVNHKIVDRLLFVEPILKNRVQDYAQMSFYAKQMRIALRNCGLIDPEMIEEYIANEGYLALAKCLFDMTPEQVVQEVLNSGLCGRGGAGFPTGLKWKIAAGVKADEKYIVCNADVDKLYITSGEREGSINQLLGIAAERGIPITECDRSKLDAIAKGGRHQGIIAMAAERNYSSIDDIIAYAEERGEAPFVVVCDGVEDPHNLGAIIRSAECVGAHGIVIPKRRAVGLTATVAKSSAGALEHMRVAKVTNLPSAIDSLKERGLWVYAADMDGGTYYKTDMKGPMALVLGSEGFGISRLVKEKCDFTVSIPLYGQVNSMNVSCAAAILLAEVARQRNDKEV